MVERFSEYFSDPADETLTAVRAFRQCDCAWRRSLWPSGLEKMG
jgi:hypothetical protein